MSGLSGLCTLASSVNVLIIEYMFIFFTLSCFFSYTASSGKYINAGFNMMSSFFIFSFSYNSMAFFFTSSFNVSYASLFFFHVLYLLSFSISSILKQSSKWARINADRSDDDASFQNLSVLVGSSGLNMEKANAWARSSAFS